MCRYRPEGRTYIADRKGHDQRYAIDPSKAMAELGWAPTTMIADGIKLTIQWYKNHMDWMAECTSGEYVKYYEEMYGRMTMLIKSMIMTALPRW